MNSDPAGQPHRREHPLMERRGRFAKLWCFFGVHEFVILRTGNLTIYRHGKVTREGYFYDLRCPVCGSVKTQNT